MNITRGRVATGGYARARPYVQQKGSTMTTSQEWHLVRRPHGAPVDEDFALGRDGIGDLGPDECFGATGFGDGDRMHGTDAMRSRAGWR